MAFRHDTQTPTPPLLPGVSRLTRSQVADIQRRRLLAAALDAISDGGYARTTVQQITRCAKVSRKTFYETFADREDCFLALLKQAFSEVGTLVRNAYDSESTWREGIRSALAELLALMQADPRLSRLLLVESLADGGPVAQHRAEAFTQLAKLIDEGRLATIDSYEPPKLTAETVVGGVFAVLHTRRLQERDEPLTDLLGPLMSTIVLPYLGADAASQELSRPAPPRRTQTRPQPPATSRDPLAGLNIRLTYRTVLVLNAISEHPGASNREIAARSGIVDQGQISKLLTRLARLDLTENLGEGKENGGANAWRLTALGTRLERATRPH
jgi:AcrR family transcriptional regulator